MHSDKPSGKSFVSTVPSDPSQLPPICCLYFPKSAKVPCAEAGLQEMLKLMDFDRDKEISWREFHTFISYKVLDSQDVLDGELVLPSGLTLPLGAMIVALRRKQVMKEILMVRGKFRKV